MNEKCGIGAAVDVRDGRNVTPLLVDIMSGLQHRGQLGAGIAIQESRDRFLKTIKNNGPVEEVLHPLMWDSANESASGIGHTRYATSGSRDACLAQPFLYKSPNPAETFAMAFNGNIANFPVVARELEERGRLLRHRVDTEAILQLMIEQVSVETRFNAQSVFTHLHNALDGAYNIVAIDGLGNIHAYRDSHGFRPAVVAMHDGIGMVASEDSAIAKISPYADMRSILPGELISFIPGVEKIQSSIIAPPEPSRCFFEWIYFSNHQTSFDGVKADTVRRTIGESLAKEDGNLPSDISVMPVPFSSIPSAKGYAKVRGRYAEGIAKINTKRTFIEAENRAERAKNAYALQPHLLRGKDLVLIDDSVVRGTTIKALVQRLREEGDVRSIHLRIASPPILNPCFYGIDMSKFDELIARSIRHSSLLTGILKEAELKKIAENLCVDSMRYASVEDVVDAITKERSELCMACVDGKYPTSEGRDLYQLMEGDS